MNRIALIFLSAVLLGCAVFDGPYRWRYAGHACAPYSWTKVDAERLESFCGKYRDDLPGHAVGCRIANTCAIVSVYAEDEAKSEIGIDGMTVYDHEIKHTKGFVHD